MNVIGFSLVCLVVGGLVYQFIKKAKQIKQRQELEFEGYCLLVHIQLNEETGTTVGTFQQGERQWKWIIPFSMRSLETPVRGYAIVRNQTVMSFD